jgi:hypothetical protein
MGHMPSSGGAAEATPATKSAGKSGSRWIFTTVKCVVLDSCHGSAK